MATSRLESKRNRSPPGISDWPRLGYDPQHPDELPPSPEAGGWDGMKRLYETCRELGYLFTLHDQYRNYYLDAPSYDPQFARRRHFRARDLDNASKASFRGFSCPPENDRNFENLGGR